MNTPSGHNPYQPPKADVTPPAQQPDGNFIAGGQAVLPGRGVSWIGGGWTLFTKSPGIWIANIIILFVLSIAVALIPIIGSLAQNLLMPVIIGGIMIGCRSLDEGGELRVDHLFAGFKERGGQLVLVGLLMLVGTVVVFIAVIIVGVALFGSTILQAITNEQAIGELFNERSLMMLLLLALLFMALIVPLAMAYWFAPALVVFHGLDAMDAMKQSFQGCLRNVTPFLVYGIVFLLLLIVAIIPVFLGLLVLVPMGYGSVYASYKDIYLTE